VPAIVGFCGLGDVRDGQRIGRRHAITEAEKNNKRARTKNSEHEHPPYVKQSMSFRRPSRTPRAILRAGAE